ncbi:hypothetical protein CsatB_023404 [Cannabis sativa]|uniref:uncharacterized protein LOC115713313 n=1 Tax=Cannabis sativa TaxID=3483 RepID=UPI0029CA3D58|nr:uncharacterized protein LOC115713313 [Cannabis sativa]
MPRTRAIGSRNSGQAPLPNNSSSILDAPPNPPIIPLASAITGDIVPPSPNATTRPVHEGSSSPYFLNSSDNPGLTLVTPLLSDKNFQSWRRDFELSVGARNKAVFLKGTLPQPPIDHPLHHHWFRCNQMVMSWILHSVSPDTKSSIMFLDTAAEMWQELNSRYDQGNGPRIFELRESLITLHQGDDSVSSYFSKLKCMWDEIQELCPQIPCTCAASIDNLAFLNQEQLKFCIDPFPSLSKVFSIVIHEERQQKLKTPQIPSLVASTQGSFTNPAIAQNPSASAADANQNHNKRMRPYCTNCHKPGHLKEKCFFLIGFPPGYGDKKKETQAVANQASTSTDPISFLANLTKPKDI